MYALLTEVRGDTVSEGIGSEGWGEASKLWAHVGTSPLESPGEIAVADLPVERPQAVDDPEVGVALTVACPQGFKTEERAMKRSAAIGKSARSFNIHH
jgi:hypothetical protein